MTLDPPESSSEGTPNLSVMALTLRQSCVELMAHYGVNVTPHKWRASAETPSAPLVATVDFDGRLLRGSIVLHATRSVILETAHGASGMQTKVPRSLSDWNGELLNQLLGRVKNKLRARDVSVDVGVPRPLSMDLALPRYDVRQCFSCPAGTVSIFLAVLFEPGLVLGGCVSDEGLPSEGEILLF